MTNVLNHLDWSFLVNILLTVIPALVCITLHELSHGLVAYKLGDPTAKNAGRLTLNPIKHIDIMGLLMMLIARFGWAKPVPVDMRYFKNPKRGMAVTALAGPVSNVLIAAVAFALYGGVFDALRKSGVGQVILEIIYTTGYLSLALALFNLIPIPPLDGSKVLFSLLPDRAYGKLLHYERYGSILLLLIVVLGVTRGPLQQATSYLVQQFLHISVWMNSLISGLVNR